MLTYQPPADADIFEVARRMTQAARVADCYCTARFNGVDLIATPDAEPEEILASYRRGFGLAMQRLARGDESA